ncbi:MAG TPA: TadG family pilus assembly protein [Tepidisphaeraceae bacterium]|nr:TadG family pilus assembly protein [Tepidisphaeraceae bacterium]
MIGRKKKGNAIIYMLVYMMVLSAFCSLAVDLGRVQLAKTELRRAADGAARAGAAGIPTDTATATSLALQYAALNKVDGTPLSLNASQDIEYGRWDTAAKTFTVKSDPSDSSINAIHVTARRTAKRGNAIPMLFISLLGFRQCDVNAESIVMVIPPIHVDQFVPADANPFLAGMPAGTKASKINPSPRKIPDIAGTASDPKNSPLAVALGISGGATYTFDSIDGTARHDPGLNYYNPDGDTGDSKGIGHNNSTTVYDNNYGSTMYNENGIADAWIPINALVGVFLDDNAPNLTSAPANLDFRDHSSSDPDRNIIDFQKFEPKLKQLFFIGDGLDKNGNQQQFIAPPGATRLYLATMDYYEWNNNAGSRNIKVNRPMQIITVK